MPRRCRLPGLSPSFVASRSGSPSAGLYSFFRSCHILLLCIFQSNALLILLSVPDSCFPRAPTLRAPLAQLRSPSWTSNAPTSALASQSAGEETMPAIGCVTRRPFLRVSHLTTTCGAASVSCPTTWPTTSFNPQIRPVSLSTYREGYLN